MKKYSYLTTRGKRRMFSINQIIRYAHPAKSDSKKRKAYKIKLAMRISKIISETEVKPIIEAKRPAEKPTAARSVCVHAVVGLKYDSKKRPFFCALAAKTFFKNSENFSSNSLLDGLKNRLENLLVDWGRAGGSALSVKGYYLDSPSDNFDGWQFGIVDDKMPNDSKESKIDWEFYVIQDSKVKPTYVKKGSERNVLE